METIESSKVEKYLGDDIILSNGMSLEEIKLTNYIRQFVPIEADDTFEFKTSNPFNVEYLKSTQVKNIINYRRINDIRYVNKFFEAVNRKMPNEGFFVCCLESKSYRTERILNGSHPVISYPHCFFDFMVKRVIPKIPVLKKFYFSVTKGRNRVISLSEALGRLISCGFDIVEFKTFGNITYIISQKKREPYYDTNPTYGTLIRLNRVGKDGKMIKVYKMRTMHPYSEYLQDFLYKTNDLQDGGKINNDYRVTSYGKLFRKLWIDELPMLINWIKGELKIVGVRPLSQHYYSLYPKDMQALRTKFKPGLVPPFYADMPVTFDDIVESEKRYLESYSKAPLKTDIRYFFMSFYNIFFKKARSA